MMEDGTYDAILVKYVDAEEEAAEGETTEGETTEGETAEGETAEN